MRELIRGFWLAACVSLLAMTGCRTPLVETTVVNSGTAELHNIEVDYPSASFGISDLAPGAVFHYRFQIQNAGRLKVEFFDSAQHSYSGKGTYITEGQQGTLQLTLDGNGKNTWSANLHPAVSTPKGE